MTTETITTIGELVQYVRDIEGRVAPRGESVAWGEFVERMTSICRDRFCVHTGCTQALSPDEVAWWRGAYAAVESDLTGRAYMDYRETH